MSDLVAWTQYLPELAGGLGPALTLTGLALAFGYPLGLLLTAGVASNRRTVSWPALAVVEVGRGMPLLVLLYLVYQGFPQAGFTPSGMVSAVAAFTLSTGAYSTEVIRSSIGAVPPGQSEAAVAAGMSTSDTFRLIVLPQALRVALPPLMSLAIQIFQLSSLAYVVTVSEIMQAAKFRGTVTFDFLAVFVAAAVLYASITIPSSLLVTKLESRLARHV